MPCNGIVEERRRYNGSIPCRENKGLYDNEQSPSAQYGVVLKGKGAFITNDEYFELKADYEHAINALSGEIEVFEKSMDSLDNQLARYRAMEKDAKTLAQDHVLTAELIERLIERIEIDHERNIHVTFRFKKMTVEEFKKIMANYPLQAV